MRSFVRWKGWPKGRDMKASALFESASWQPRGQHRKTRRGEEHQGPRPFHVLLTGPLSDSHTRSDAVGIYRLPSVRSAHEGAAWAPTDPAPGDVSRPHARRASCGPSIVPPKITLVRW